MVFFSENVNIQRKDIASLQTLNKISNVGRAIQFIAWKNTGAGSSYPAIKLNNLINLDSVISIVGSPFLFNPMIDLFSLNIFF